MPTFFVETAHVEGSPWHAATSSVRILLRLFGSLKKIFRSNKLLFRPLTLNPTRSRPKFGSSFYLATYCGTNSAAIFQFWCHAKCICNASGKNASCNMHHATRNASCNSTSNKQCLESVCDLRLHVLCNNPNTPQPPGPTVQVQHSGTLEGCPASPWPE